MRERGLTLIEFLVVIAVLAVTGSALALHIMNKRRTALTTSCVGTLKQNGLGFEMYSSSQIWGTMPVPISDTNGLIDTAAEAYDALGCLYAGGEGVLGDARLFTCPSDPGRDRLDRATYDWKDGSGTFVPTINSDSETSYVMTQFLSADQHSSKIIMGDQPRANVGGEGDGRANHQDGQILLYRDSHVNFSPTVNPSGGTDFGPGHSIYMNDRKVTTASPAEDIRDEVFMER